MTSLKVVSQVIVISLGIAWAKTKIVKRTIGFVFLRIRSDDPETSLACRMLTLLLGDD